MRCAVLIPLLVTACTAGDEGTFGANIECSLSGAAGFAPDCSMETVEDEDRRLLIVRHPDGGFRRFELGVAGHGIVTADGVEQAEISRSDGVVEVRVGADRYRLPVAE